MAVIVVGAANLDITAHAKRDFLYGESNLGQIRMAAGGVGRNIAENLARFGMKVQLITVLGNDFAAELIKDGARACQLNLANSRFYRGRQSSYAAIFTEDGELAYGINDMEMLDLISPEFLEEKRDLLLEAELIVIDANLSRDAIAFLASSFADKKLYLDPVSAAKTEKIRDYIGAIDTVKPNRSELATLVGRELFLMDDYIGACQELHDLGVRQIYLTLGSDGTYYSGPEGALRVEVGSKVRGNVSGAGDAFFSACIYAETRGVAIERRIQFANEVAALTMQVEAANNPLLSSAVLDKYL